MPAAGPAVACSSPWGPVTWWHPPVTFLCQRGLQEAACLAWTQAPWHRHRWPHSYRHRGNSPGDPEPGDKQAPRCDYSWWRSSLGCLHQQEEEESHSCGSFGEITNQAWKPHRSWHIISTTGWAKVPLPTDPVAGGRLLSSATGSSSRVASWKIYSLKQGSSLHAYRCDFKLFLSCFFLYLLSVCGVTPFLMCTLPSFTLCYFAPLEERVSKVFNRKNKNKTRTQAHNSRGSFLLLLVCSCFNAINHFILNKVRWRPISTRPGANNPHAGLSSMLEVTPNADSTMTAPFNLGARGRCSHYDGECHVRGHISGEKKKKAQLFLMGKRRVESSTICFSSRFPPASVCRLEASLASMSSESWLGAPLTLAPLSPFHHWSGSGKAPRRI